MKIILATLILMTAFRTFATELDPKERKAIAAAKSLYAMNISPEKDAAHFTLSKKTCGGEDGTQVCVYKISVKEKDPSAGVTSYLATFMNDQLTKAEQNCKYCW